MEGESASRRGVTGSALMVRSIDSSKRTRVSFLEGSPASRLMMRERSSGKSNPAGVTAGRGTWEAKGERWTRALKASKRRRRKERNEEGEEGLRRQ